MITGRCECGAVQYQVTGELVDFCHCHCSSCRRIHGAAFATWAGVARDDFCYTAGGDKVRAYAFSENADSIFCGNCSSTLLVDYKPEEDMLYLTAGTINGELSILPAFHQFVGSKAPWFEIHDDLPQYLEWPEQS